MSTFEYQRRYPIKGWLPLMLPTDPAAWSDETGRFYVPLSSFKETPGWMWTTDLNVDLFRCGVSCVCVCLYFCRCCFRLVVSRYFVLLLWLLLLFVLLVLLLLCERFFCATRVVP